MGEKVTDLMGRWPKCGTLAGGGSEAARRAWCVLDKWEPVGYPLNTIAACRDAAKWQGETPHKPCFLRSAADIWNDLRSCCTLMFTGDTNDEGCKQQGSVDGGPIAERCMAPRCWAAIRAEHTKLKAPSGLLPLFERCRIAATGAPAAKLESLGVCKQLYAEGQRSQVELRRVGSSLLAAAPGTKPCFLGFSDPSPE